MECPILLLLTFVFMGLTSIGMGTIFDDVQQRLEQVTSQSCSATPVQELPMEDVSQLPRHQNATYRQPKNRTSLQYAFNTAVSRAFYLSSVYALTKRAWRFKDQPGLNNFYMAAAASVQAGPNGIATSGVFFAKNSAYINWLNDVSFNQTAPLFAARANAVGQDQSIVNIRDLGSSTSTNYTLPGNVHYRFLSQGFQPGLREIFSFRHHKAQGVIETTSFKMNFARTRQLGYVGRPYFDCGYSNKWLVDVGAAVTELLPRYMFYTHLQSFKSAAVATVGVEFQSIDINTCPLSIGNTPPNAFAGSANCDDQQGGTDQTLECQPLTGQGFANAFRCCSPSSCHSGSISNARRSAAQTALASVEAGGCQSGNTGTVLDEAFWNLSDLKVTFEVEGRSGLRIALFLSNFLQNNNLNAKEINREYFWELYRNVRWDEPLPEPDTPLRYINGDHSMNRDSLLLEAFSTMMADGQLASVGIFMEAGFVYNSSQPVGAFAWRADVENSGNVADLYQLGENFLQLDWYTQARTRFNATQASQLKTYENHEEVRTMGRGRDIVRQVPDPIPYIAVNYDAGMWLPPHFRCDDRQRGWITSYVVPVVALGNGAAGVQFAGVVRMDATFTSNHVSPQ